MALLTNRIPRLLSNASNEEPLAEVTEQSPVKDKRKVVRATNMKFDLKRNSSPVKMSKSKAANTLQL